MRRAAVRARAVHRHERTPVVHAPWLPCRRGPLRAVGGTNGTASVGRADSERWRAESTRFVRIRAPSTCRFETLHHDGRALVQGWRERAASSREGDAFEAFIYLWIAFNSWAACVTGSDGDREWQDKLVTDPALNDLTD